MRDTLRQERVRGEAFPQGYPPCHHMSHMPPHGIAVAPRTARDVPLPMRLAPRWRHVPDGELRVHPSAAHLCLQV